MPKPAKAQQLDVVKGYTTDASVIWFELNEVDTRLLAQGLVSSEVREQAAAAIAWLEDDPVGYQDEDFLRGAR